MIQPIGGLFPVAEIQSRWFALLINNKLVLPSSQEIIQDIQMKRNVMKKWFDSGDILLVDYIPFLDQIAQLINAKPNLLK